MHTVVATGAVNSNALLDGSQVGMINIPQDILSNLPDMINFVFTVYRESTLFPVTEPNTTVASQVLGGSIADTITTSLEANISLLLQLNPEIMTMVRLCHPGSL